MDAVAGIAYLSPLRSAIIAHVFDGQSAQTRTSSTMKKTHPLRASLQRLLPSVAVFGKALGLVYSKRSMLRELGYIESSRTKRPCRRDGSPLPWMNYHVIAFLEERLNKNLSLFEYGSGTSTSFYASLVDQVVSVETNPDWYAEVRETVPENVELKFIDAEARQQYCELAEKENRKFDVIVVDDLDRTECVIEAPKALSDGGVIVLDDYHAEIHRPAIDSLKSRGFRELRFAGLKPGSIQAYRTTIFYRDGNCLGI